MIRDATQDDVPAIVEMARDFWQYSSTPEIPFDDLTVETFVEHCLSINLLCVLEIEGKTEGFAAGIAGASLVNADVIVGTEVAWWVNPDHRAGRNGIKLLHHLENLAKLQDIEYWVQVYMESSMPDKIERIYIKDGYSKGETSYIKRLV